MSFIKGPGDYMGLYVVMTPEINKYISYTQSFFGVHVGIHAPDEFADFDNLVVAQPGYDLKIMLTPSVLVSDPDVSLLFFIFFF